ncbi:MAG: YkgJ family cysteine cluster protein [Lachnospiraceae bacterium]|nr:YkgJ family cysteine cluster protein [Lachnospiraceae bacterium]
MKRKVSLEEISDGRLYSRNDMVRAGCGGCRGCSECCSGMGNSVILDPLDIFRLTTGLGITFEELMADKIELNVVDGIILPNLKMSTGSETCAFLNAEGRCSIHPYRPGVCRLFPLGRYYETKETDSSNSKSGGQIRTFRYFLQVHECPMPSKTKVKVEKWIDTPKLASYETFVKDWHYFLEDVQERLAQEDDTVVKNANMFLLKLFYIRSYDGGRDFYCQFEERLVQAKDVLEIS